MRKTYIISNYLFLVPFMGFYAVFMLWPVVHGAFLSFFDMTLLSPESSFVGLQQYRKLVSDPLWWKSLLNTLIFTALSLSGITLFSLLAALIVNSPKLKGRVVYRVVFFAPFVISVSAMSIIWQWMLNTDFGLLNYYLGRIGLPKVNWLGSSRLVLPSLSLATIWWQFGLPMLIFLAGLTSISREFYEAAVIDGAGAWRKFISITIPLLKHATMFVLLTQFVFNFQAFGQFFIFFPSGGANYNALSLVLYLYQNGWRFFLLSYAATIGVMIVLVMMAIVIPLIKWFGTIVEY